MTVAADPVSTAEAEWLRSPWGRVFSALRESLDSPLAAMVPGTSAAIDGALVTFRYQGDAAVVRRLEAIALAVHEWQLALRLGAEDAVWARRTELSGMAKEWLMEAPVLVTVPRSIGQAA